MMRLKNLLLSAAAALSLHLSCAEEAPECFSYNETTQSINRTIDGEISSYDIITQPPSNQIISEPVIDFVNETHALATEPLPGNISVTRVPRYCVDPGIAYSYHGDEWTRGIYFAVDLDPTEAIETLNHEIGHLQPGGSKNEVMAELNMFEQRTMAYLLFTNTEEDIFKWAYGNYGIDSYLSDMSDAVDDLPGSGTPRYNNADIFLLVHLSDPSMDFRTLRDQIVQSDAAGTLEYDIQQTANDFWERYDIIRYDNNPLARRADLVLVMATAFVRELGRSFGEDMAQQYIAAQAFFPYESWERIPVVGLEERVCYMTADNSDPQQGCELQVGSEGIFCEQPRSVDFCCIGLDGDRIYKSIVHTEGGCLVSENIPPEMILNGLLWPAVDWLMITSEQELPLDELCR